jgi:hypothetical protein
MHHASSGHFQAGRAKGWLACVAVPSGRDQQSLAMVSSSAPEVIMTGKLAFWIAISAAFLSSYLALRVAIALGIPDGVGAFSAGLDAESRSAGVASLAALVSVIAQLIEKASR